MFLNKQILSINLNREAIPRVVAANALSPVFGQTFLDAYDFQTISLDKPKIPARLADTLLNAAQFLDRQLLPKILSPLFSLLSQHHVSPQEMANWLRGRPNSLSNQMFRTRYSRNDGVHVYGSARPKPDNSLAGFYNLGLDVGKRLVKEGLFPVTGGGPGIMQSVAEGAYKAGGHTVGVSLDFPGEAILNKNMYQELINAPTFTHRLKGPGGFNHRAARVLVLPGGLGTSRELLEAMEEFAYGDHLSQFPMQKQIVILDNQQFFSKTLKPYIETLITEKVVSSHIYDSLKLVSTLDEAIAALKDKTVPWSTGVKRNQDRNMNFSPFSLSDLGERFLHS